MIDVIVLVRLLFVLGATSVCGLFVAKHVREFVRRRRLVDLIPGPTRFSAVLGNVPLEIVKYIGASFDESKDLYYSECRRSN